MKRTFCALLVVGLMAVAGAASAAALPEVTLGGACAWLTALNGGLIYPIDAVLDGVGAIDSGEGESAATMDFDGDGMPEWALLSLLGAAMCSGEADAVSDQYTANAALYADMLSDFSTMLDSAYTDNVPLQHAAIVSPPTPAVPPGVEDTGVAMDAEAAALALAPIIDGLPNTAPYYLKTVAGAVYLMLDGAYDGLTSLSKGVPNFNLYVMMLSDPAMAQWFVGMGGLGSETKAVMDYLVNVGMLGDMRELASNPDWTGPDEQMGTDDDEDPGLIEIAALTNTLGGALYSFHINETVGAQLVAVAAEVDGLGDAMLAIVDPDWDIYGVAKAAGQPFSGTGDYNGNGDTNAAVYAAVGGDVAKFVAAASGSEIWYPGNPDLPVAGLFGLALLAGACVLGGAASIRRK